MRHPRERRLDRRDFLYRGGATVAGLSSLGALLAACGGNGEAAPAAPPPVAEPGAPPPAESAPTSEPPAAEPTPPPEDSPFPLARPDSPVTLPIFDDNPPIDSGLQPEEGPLRVYNWFEYIWKKKIKEFEEQFSTKVELSTFYTMDEAVAKLATGAVDFDVFFPTPDRLARLAFGKVLQPLNRDYLPNLGNMWPAYQNPFYDQEARYTVPYTVYTSGIGYLRTQVATDPFDLANGYEILWDEANAGKTFVLDDGRESPALMLLKNGITDVNTEDPAHIELAKNELLSLIPAVNIKYSNEAFSKVPEGVAWVHHTWSGDMLAAPGYVAGGIKPEDLGYWYPPEGGGIINNDLIGVLRGSKRPVLAHAFLNFMLDEEVAFDNFVGWNGYQPPLQSISPDSLISEGLFPENLASAVVREEDFLNANLLLELTPEGQVLWQNAWAEFLAGV